jgi:hypothetical protein
MATQKKSFFKIAKGIVFLLVQLVWFFVISIPLALALLILIESVSVIKLIYNQIKSVCQKITTR